MKRILVSAALAASALVTTSSFADVAPPDDFEEDCTVDIQQGLDEECVSCRVSFQDFDACKNQYEPKGYALRCKTYGASVFDEVYCRASTDSGNGGSDGDPQSDPTDPDVADDSGDDPVANGDEASDASDDGDDDEANSDGGGCTIGMGAQPFGAGALAFLGLAIGMLRRRRNQ